ncbi:hypothetical protein Pla144_36440 [Bythopirellula polymerisocia]|uniref:Uncharacterized protein n=1 Tax=Bythopirellula polymerisocia TaxID=2528003 RepID=A0A5C6CJX2_9BACT|nr:hypothetical protein Pla144_36440 [Bythopirellula polymerisocia]
MLTGRYISLHSEGHLAELNNEVLLELDEEYSFGKKADSSVWLTANSNP